MVCEKTEEMRKRHIELFREMKGNKKMCSKIYTVREVANVVGVSTQAVYGKIDRGELVTLENPLSKNRKMIRGYDLLDYLLWKITS